MIIINHYGRNSDTYPMGAADEWVAPNTNMNAASTNETVEWWTIV
jgi:hypothetical protein